ncbi:MAG TPA: hypothetical protein VHY22_10220 [Chthoniobacteraceae bacterium]|jgi:hypothetical protein|nr:hypothetical protein [Chthoniobacteraceae bacterium]
MAWALLSFHAMKMRNPTAKKIGPRKAVRHENLNLPRVYLFLELFVEKEISGRSAK